MIWTQRSWWITVFEKTMENVRKCRTIKLATTEQKEETSWCENNLSYKKIFLWKPIRNRNEKNTDIMNKYLGLSILKLSKIVKYEFWYDYVKLKYGEKSKTVIWIQTVSLYTWYDIYKDIAEDVETRSDSSNYELDRLLPERKK